MLKIVDGLDIITHYICIFQYNTFTYIHVFPSSSNIDPFSATRLCLDRYGLSVEFKTDILVDNCFFGSKEIHPAFTLPNQT